MTDPFPELPRRVLFVDVKPEKFVPPKAVDDYFKQLEKPRPATKIANATKPAQRNATKGQADATKIHALTKKKDGRGRPAKGDKPMTSTERSRLRRAAKKAGA